MPRQQSNDLKHEDMLTSWCRVSQRMAIAAGETPPDWADLDEVEQAAWGYAFAECSKILSDEPSEGTTFAAIAGEVYEAYRRVVQDYVGTLPSWEDQTEALQLHWKCLVRHAVNLLTYDPEEHGSLDQHEETMAGFFETKLAELGMTEAQREVNLDNRDRQQENR